MLEVPDEFFNGEDGSCLEAGDMDDSKEETDGHTLESNNNNEFHRRFSPRLRGYESTCHGVKRGYVGQAIDTYHCAMTCMLSESLCVPGGLTDAVSIYTICGEFAVPC
jgi:hypothetical protein